MNLADAQDIVDVTLNMPGLHLHHPAHCDLLLLAARPADDDAARPGVGHPSKQLCDVTPVRVKESKRRLDVPGRISPVRNPLILWPIPVPMQSKDGATRGMWLPMPPLITIPQSRKIPRPEAT